MYFMMAYMMTFIGIMLAGIFGLMPIDIYYTIPDFLKMMFLIVGMILSFFGLLLLHIRSIKVGANHLIAPGRPENILWFYVYRDGTIKITPSFRDVENQLYAKELDAQIHDLKSYKLFDHSIRFVPEGVGHTVDFDMCLYAYILKTRYGFSNILQARKNIFGSKEKLVSKEHLITGSDLNEITRQQIEERGRPE